MKKISIGIFGLALSGLFYTGCTDEVSVGGQFIDQKPSGTMNLDSIFSNADYTQQFLNNIYARQYYGFPFTDKPRAHSQSVWNGKLDALTDLYQVHYAGSQVWNGYYMGTMTAKDEALIAFNNEQVWETVNMVNVLKENIDRVPDLDRHRRDYMLAQATALQAFAYSVLLPHYGGLPIITHTIADGTGLYPRATFAETVDSIVSWCDAAKDHLYWKYDGNDAESSQLQTGRWTKAGVMALKAQVLWLAASPLYNSDTPYYGGSEAEAQNLVWYGNYDSSRWNRALKAFEEFRAENEAHGNSYHLNQAVKKTCDGYRIAYRRGYILDDSPENIHWTKVTGFWGRQGTYHWYDWNTWGVQRLNLSPTVEYIEMFPWSDGKPFNRETDMKYKETYKVDKDESTWDVYTCLQSSTSDKLFYKYTAVRGGFTKTATRDPRLYENARVSGVLQTLDLYNPEVTTSGRVIENWVGGQDAQDCVKNYDGTLAEKLTSLCPTGFTAYKYLLDQSEYWRDPNVHWNVLTIPDMILMYAECLAECNRLQDAIDQVDLIRARVGMKSINSSYNASKNLASNKENLIEEILRERACELGVTNARYIDMIRRKRTDWMTKHLTGMATYRMIKDAENNWVRRNAPWYGDDKNSGMSEPSRFEYEFFPLIQGVRVLWGADPDSKEVKKWLMMPFIEDEINKGYGLVQNPGWEAQ